MASIGQKSTTTSSINAPSASEIISIAGAGNQIIKEDNMMMTDNAKVVTGNNYELGLGSTLTDYGGIGGDLVSGTKAGGDIIDGIKLESGSSFYVTDMSDNTQGLLSQAMNMVSLNANNYMAFAAGRDPNAALADQSNEIYARTAGVSAAWSGVSKVFTPARIAAAAAAVFGIWWLLKGRGK
ncbi:MAG: hypothetical protein WC959_07645 [Kiritimatiellales bacterium]